MIEAEAEFYATSEPRRHETCEWEGVQHANMLIARLAEKSIHISCCIDKFLFIDHVSLSANEMTSQPGLYLKAPENDIQAQAQLKH
jgi:hypothetical protein